jgi:hypothetical protein
MLMAIVTSSASRYWMIGIVYDLRMSSSRPDVTFVIAERPDLALLGAATNRHDAVLMRRLPSIVADVSG